MITNQIGSILTILAPELMITLHQDSIKKFVGCVIVGVSQILQSSTFSNLIDVSDSFLKIGGGCTSLFNQSFSQRKINIGITENYNIYISITARCANTGIIAELQWNRANLKFRRARFFLCISISIRSFVRS